MFRLSARPLAHPKASGHCRDPESGARVTFEGRVRAKNRRKRVLFLAYEALEKSCVSEFRKIAKKAFRKFGVADIECVHRTGRVRAGELAVWLAVTAKHRTEAFRACRFVIDELKKRLPIWKKEHYADGSHRWLANSRRG